MSGRRKSGTPWAMMAGEVTGAAEWAAFFATKPWLSTPSGDGHPVLVLPGMMASDLSMSPMRQFLESCGFDAHPWGEGRNTGPREQTMDALAGRIRRMSDKSKAPVSLVGWSLGGAMAAGLASEMPDRVRCVVTLGSPLDADPRNEAMTALFERVSGMRADDSGFGEQLRGHPDVPMTSILARGDGIVHWRSSVLEHGPLRETVRIRGASHLGLPANPAALLVVADRLAQAPGQWRKFKADGLLGLMAAPVRGRKP